MSATRSPSSEGLQFVLSDSSGSGYSPATKARSNTQAALADNAAVPGRTVLTSWKEIASHLGRGVRTVQRYERQLRLPIRRPMGRDRTSVMAFSDELDQWLNRAPLKEHRHVRPVLLVLDHAAKNTLSDRKLLLESARFNVLSVFSTEEIFETAEKFHVDACILDFPHDDAQATEICSSLKERHPERPIFAVVPDSPTNGHALECVDCVVSDRDPRQLLAAVIQMFGRQEPE